MLYDKIQRLCQERGISVYRLETDLGFGKSSVQRWKTASPTVRNLKKVADYFGVTVDALLKEGR